MESILVYHCEAVLTYKYYSFTQWVVPRDDGMGAIRGGGGGGGERALFNGFMILVIIFESTKISDMIVKSSPILGECDVN
jgi:hypothetical protein